jgi:glycosyltransferase involved in cell wall biosynthesis
MACGTPVIAGNYGGTAESVINGVTGILFPDQKVESIVEAVKKFDIIAHSINYSAIRSHSEKFSRENFERNIKNFVDEKARVFQNGNLG